MRICVYVIVSAINLLALPAFCLAQTRLYDDFSGPAIDPNKWYAVDGGSWAYDSQRVLVPIRGAKGHELHLMQRSYAPTTNDNNGVGALFGLGFPNPAAITAASFMVTVNKDTIIPCTGNASNGAVNSADFRGTFFNTQKSPTSVLGDVEADISVQQSSQQSESGLQVVGFVSECADTYCGTQTVLFYRTLGDVQLGSSNSIGFSWDKANHRFIFSFDGAQTTWTYKVSDHSPPYSPGKTIDIARVVPDCDTKPRPYSLIDVDIGAIYINQN